MYRSSRSLRCGWLFGGRYGLPPAILYRAPDCRDPCRGRCHGGELCAGHHQGARPAEGQLGDVGSGSRRAQRHLWKIRSQGRDALYIRRRRDHAGAHFRQRRHCHFYRNGRDPECVCKGRAHSTDRRVHDRRRRPVLVRAGGLADPLPQRCCRQDHGLFRGRLLVQPCHHRADPSGRCRYRAGCDRHARRHIRCGDVRTGGHRVVRSARSASTLYRPARFASSPSTATFRLSGT